MEINMDVETSNGNNTIDNSRKSESVRVRRRTVIGASTMIIASWHRPVIDALILPAHAQTSAVAGDGLDANNDEAEDDEAVITFTMNSTADVNSGITGSVTGAVPGEIVWFYVIVFDSDAHPRPERVEVETTADSDGAASFARSPAQMLAATGLIIQSGDTVVVQVETEGNVQATDSSLVA